MPFVEFTESDLLRNKIVTPAWYELDVTGPVSEWTESKDKQSKNLTIECVIVKNDEDGSTEFSGVPITLQFNDKPKARGFIEGFFRGLGEDVQVGRYNFDSAVGKKLSAHVENETYEGRIRNRVNHKYRLVRS